MALVSHLDLVRLFDRVVRRASLPISFTGGFHPGPRISIANALSLGATSSSEIVDFELTERVDLSDFRNRLELALPNDLPVYHVEEIDLDTLAATRLLDRAEYLITVETSEPASLSQWQTWLDQVNNTQEVPWDKITKSGNINRVNLRDRLFSLSLETQTPQETDRVILRYIGRCRNDGTLLQPEQVVYMLQQVTENEFHLIHTHRQQLILSVG